MELLVTRYVNGVAVTRDQLLSVTVPDNRFGEAVARAREHEEAMREGHASPKSAK